MPVTVGSLLVRYAIYLVLEFRFKPRLSKLIVVKPPVELKVSTAEAVVVSREGPTELVAWFLAFVSGFHCAIFSCSEDVIFTSALSDQIETSSCN